MAINSFKNLSQRFQTFVYFLPKGNSPHPTNHTGLATRIRSVSIRIEGLKEKKASSHHSMFNKKLVHIRQDYDWDCGLACVRMVLNHALGVIDRSNFHLACQELNFGTNVWTIDLARILTYFKVDYIFYTETFGVDMSYRDTFFYEDSFDVDEKRVNNLFTCANELKIQVKKRSNSLDDICANLDVGSVAIVLVDSNGLHCKWCRLTSKHRLRYLLHRYKQGCGYHMDYAGHYIVVCGYNIDIQCFYYKDPSCEKTLCCIPFKEFEKAWSCHGTDKDIIFIDVKSKA